MPCVIQELRQERKQLEGDKLSVDKSQEVEIHSAPNPSLQTLIEPCPAPDCDPGDLSHPSSWTCFELRSAIES